MYVVPLIIIILACLAIFVSPIVAVILLGVALLGIGAYKYFGPGTDPEAAPPTPGQAAASAAAGARQTQPSQPGEKKGMWGEQWPEQAEQEAREKHDA